MPTPIPESQTVRDAILEVAEALLKAQLSAVQALRKPRSAPQASASNSPLKGRYSQVDIAFDILSEESSPLHVSDLIDKAKARGFLFDRESLVSALTKRVQRADRFVRTAPNTFALLNPSAPLP